MFNNRRNNNLFKQLCYINLTRCESYNLYLSAARILCGVGARDGSKRILRVMQMLQCAWTRFAGDYYNMRGLSV